MRKATQATTKVTKTIGKYKMAGDMAPGAIQVSDSSCLGAKIKKIQTAAATNATAAPATKPTAVAAR